MRRKCAHEASQRPTRPTGRSPRPGSNRVRGSCVAERMAELIERHLAKLRARDNVSAEEEKEVRSLVSHTVHVPPDRTFIRAGQDLKDSTLLLDGWMARAKDLQSGQRQLAELQLPGDFTDLHGFTLKRLDHDIVS